MFPTFINPDSGSNSGSGGSSGTGGTGVIVPGTIELIQNGEISSSVRTKLNSAINEINVVTPSSYTLIEQTTTSLTLSSIHRGRIIYYTGTGVCNITVSTSLPVGFSCELVQASTSTINTTLESDLSYMNPSKTATNGKGSTLQLVVLPSGIIFNRLLA